MLVKSFPFRYNFIECHLHIFLDCWIIVLAKSQSSRRMRQENIAQSNFKCFELLSNRLHDLVCYEITSFFPTFETKGSLKPSIRHESQISTNYQDKSRALNYNFKSLIAYRFDFFFLRVLDCEIVSFFLIQQQFIKIQADYFKMSNNPSYYTKKLLFGVTAVLVSTIALSYQIQKLHNVKYLSVVNNKTHYFKYPSLVTWLGCLFCAIYGSIYAAFYETKPNSITLKQRMRLGLLFTLNYLPTNYALLYISYPLQVITKNTRYLLVVIVGVFFSRVPNNRALKLPLSKIYIAILITFGAGLFMYFESSSKSKENHFHPQKKWIGFALLLVAIVFDAFFSDSQAYCKATFKPTQNQLFLASNLYGFVFIFGFALLNRQVYPSIAFCVSHPSAIMDIITIASLQIVSQVSIYYVISNFKQHIYPLISTVRKIFTILLSIFAFEHKVKLMQWLAIAIVFLAMGYQIYDQIMSQQHHRKMRVQKSKSASLIANPQKEKQIQSSSQNIKIESRRNNLMGRQSDKRVKQQSLSKYGYQWRRQEVAENVQPSSQQTIPL